MSKKIIYEENPWEDVKNHKESDFKVVNDLLPPPSELKNARIVVDGDELLLVHLSEKDMKLLRNMAKDGGVPCPDLAASILHEFVKNSNPNTSRL